MVRKIWILTPPFLTNSKIQLLRKMVILAEVSLILILFLYLNGLFRSLGFHDWQKPLFGTPILSSILLLFVLPLSTLLLTRRNPGTYGLTNKNLRRHARLALRAIATIMPASALFVLIGLLGMDFKHWLGAFILTLGFAAAGVVMLRYTRDLENIAETKISLYGFLAYVGMLNCRPRTGLLIPTEIRVGCANHCRIGICRISRRVPLSRVRAVTSQ